jgi:hypothetical protein
MFWLPEYRHLFSGNQNNHIIMSNSNPHGAGNGHGTPRPQHFNSTKWRIWGPVGALVAFIVFGLYFTFSGPSKSHSTAASAHTEEVEMLDFSDLPDAQVIKLTLPDAQPEKANLITTIGWLAQNAAIDGTVLVYDEKTKQTTELSQVNWRIVQPASRHRYRVWSPNGASLSMWDIHPKNM